jgi:unsaturated rhamnogalacturonyl hydrolase
MGADSENTVRERMDAVAARAMAYRYYHWDWGEAVAMEGLLRLYRLNRDPKIGAFLQRMIHGWMQHSSDPWYPDHVGPGRVLLDMWRTNGDEHLLAYAVRLGEFLTALPRSSLGAYYHRCDLPDLAAFVAVDCIQTDGPFLAALAEATGDARWHDAAVDHLLGHVAVLQDEKSGLFAHAWDVSGTRSGPLHWGRGNGWAILGLVDTLDLLPSGHRSRGRILESLTQLAGTLAKLQDRSSGLWHTVLDQPGTGLEISASLMFTAAFLLAVARGMLPSSFGEIAKSAWAGCGSRVSPEGIVQGVSARTPPRRDPMAYDAIPTGGAWPWGQGPYLIAASRYLESLRCDGGPQRVCLNRRHA